MACSTTASAVLAEIGSLTALGRPCSGRHAFSMTGESHYATGGSTMADLELSLDDLTRLARVAQDEDIYGKDLSPFRQRVPQIVLNLIGRIKERDVLLKEAGEALEGVTQLLQVFVRESNDRVRKL